jgi:hypothetical protein
VENLETTDTSLLNISFEFTQPTKFPLETAKTPTTAPTTLPSYNTPQMPSVLISFHAILALKLQTLHRQTNTKQMDMFTAST